MQPSAGHRPGLSSKLILANKQRKTAATLLDVVESKTTSALGRRLEDAEAKLQATLPQLETTLDRMKKRAGGGAPTKR